MEKSKTFPLGAKGLAYMLFGEQRANEMALRAARGDRYDYRAVFEPTDAVTQCQRAGIAPFNPGVTRCYLCGEPIPDPATLKGGPSHELYVECEHILPVAQARIWLDLYMSARPPSDDWHRGAVRLEYAYAHRVCNQAKSNDSFVEGQEDGNLVWDDVSAKKILKGIARRAIDTLRKPPPKGVIYSVAHKLLLTKISTTIQGRIATIHTSNIDPIIEYTQRPPAEVGVTTIARLALASDYTAMSKHVREVYLGSTAPTKEELDEMEEANREAFRTRIYVKYPKFRSESLAALVLGSPTLPPPNTEGGWRDVPLSMVFSEYATNRILDTYVKYHAEQKAAADAKTAIVRGSAATDVEPLEQDGLLLNTAVIHGTYLNLFKVLRTLVAQSSRPESSPYIHPFCKVYTTLRAGTFTSEWKKIEAMFGKLPNLTSQEESACVDLNYPVTSRSERAVLAAAAEEKEQEEKELEAQEAQGIPILPPPSIEEDTTFYFDGLARELVEGFGLDPATANQVETVARGAFVTGAHQYGTVQSGLDAAATEVSGLIQLLGITNPQLSSIVEGVANLIRTLRSGDEQLAPEPIEEPPAPEPAPEPAPAQGDVIPVLPPGWQVAVDPASGVSYYYNAATGVTQWEFPTQSGGKRPTRRPLYG